MTLYRPHRRLLAESLEEAVEVDSFDALVRHLVADLPEWWPEDAPRPTLDNVTVEKYGSGIDERCGWDTHLVCVGGRAWGFTSGPLEKP